MRHLRILANLLGGLLGVVYLLNPGAGMIEFLPDNLPFVGNLDEAAAVGLVITCVQGFRSLRAGRKALPAPTAGQEDQLPRKAESVS
jgi:uncharacterized membrane protein YkvA (DUF1232 family)